MEWVIWLKKKIPKEKKRKKMGEGIWFGAQLQDSVSAAGVGLPEKTISKEGKERYVKKESYI